MASADFNGVDRVVTRGKLWRVDASGGPDKDFCQFFCSLCGARQAARRIERRGFTCDFYLEPIDVNEDELAALLWDEWPRLPTKALVAMTRAALAEASP